MPEQDLKEFANQISQLKARTKRCRICMNLTEEDECSVCKDMMRDRSKITVIEDVLDLVSFETGNIYDGVYHVLHGRIDPLNHIGPDDIFIDRLLARVKPQDESQTQIKEVILAMNPDMEGEATAMYIRNKLQEIKQEYTLDFAITRLGYGLPMVEIGICRLYDSS
jgi:recombination protein RecR